MTKKNWELKNIVPSPELCKEIAQRLGTPFEVELPARYWDGTPIVLGRREENDTTE